MNNYFLTTLIAIFSLGIMTAQKTVNGIVKDKQGARIPGVSVLIKNTTKGVVTDFDGNYSIIANEGDILEFSYIGYLKQTATINVSTTYDIVMVENQQSLGEIVLTSRKKAEYAKDIPISITAIGAKELQKSGSFEFTDYASKVPNLSFGKQGGGGDLADGRTSNSISIRGVTGNATTAFYLDEIPLPETVDPKLVDIKQVEVLRGPQGTLYGSSALGGALKVLTNEPSAEGLFANIGSEISTVKEGDINYSTDFVLNAPIKKGKSAFRVVGFYNFKSGIFDKSPTLFEGQSLTPLNDVAPALTEEIENVDDERTFGFHAGLKFTPTEKLTILPKVIYQRTEADGYNLADIAPGNFTTFRAADIDEDYVDYFTTYALTAKYATDNGEFVSASSFFDRFYSETEDATEFFSSPLVFDTASSGFSFPVDISRDGDFSKFIQEFRYVSDLESKLNFSAGVFYATENLSEDGRSESPGLGQFIGAADPGDTFFDDIYRFSNDITIREFAIFTELYYNFTDKLKGTLGARYFNAASERERSVFPSLVTNYELLTGDLPELEEDGLNPKFGLSYKIDDNNLLYASVARGYRIGGVNAILPSFSEDEAIETFGTIDVPSTFKSDILWSYEIGSKLGFFDRKLVINSSVFINSWSDLQLRSLLPASGYNFITNVDKARTAGLEVDVISYPVKGLTLGGSLGYIDSEITDLGDNDVFSQAPEGAEILLIPSITAAANAEYSWDAFGGNMYVRADLQHSGERFSSFDRTPERTLAAYTIINTRIGLDLNKFNVSLFINNLTNETANFGDVISLAAEVPGRSRFATNRPITTGTSFRYRF